MVSMKFGKKSLHDSGVKSQIILSVTTSSRSHSIQFFYHEMRSHPQQLYQLTVILRYANLAAQQYSQRSSMTIITRHVHSDSSVTTFRLTCVGNK
jgi:hypothetical protein